MASTIFEISTIPEADDDFMAIYKSNPDAAAQIAALLRVASSDYLVFSDIMRAHLSCPPNNNITNYDPYYFDVCSIIELSRQKFEINRIKPLSTEDGENKYRIFYFCEQSKGFEEVYIIGFFHRNDIDYHGNSAFSRKLKERYEKYHSNY